MSDKIKVLMLGPDRSVHGGISAMVNTYYAAGLQTKVQLKYIGTMKEGSKLRKLIVAGLAYFEFVRIVNGYDIVHVNCSSDNSFLRKSYFVRTAKRRGKKIVLHQHGGDFKNYFENQVSEKRRRYMREILDMADVMLVLTDSWKEYFGKLTDPGKIFVMPNGILTREGPPSEGQHSLNKILFLGRICRDKGIGELLSAMDRIHEIRPEAVLYIGGIFEEAGYLSEIEKRSLYVKHLGWVDGEAKKKAFAECGILALPSYYEGLPVTVIEGMYAGLVPVATRVGGIPEVVSDGLDGVLIEPRDAQGLAEALLKVMNKEIDAQSFVRSGREKVLEKYSAERIVDRIAEIYQSVISSNECTV